MVSNLAVLSENGGFDVFGPSLSKFCAYHYIVQNQFMFDQITTQQIGHQVVFHPRKNCTHSPEGRQNWGLMVAQQLIFAAGSGSRLIQPLLSPHNRQPPGYTGGKS